MTRDLERQIRDVVLKANQNALESEVNLKAVRRRGWRAYIEAYSALLNLRNIARPQKDLVKLIDQLLSKVKEGMTEFDPYPNAPGNPRSPEPQRPISKEK